MHIYLPKILFHGTHVFEVPSSNFPKTILFFYLAQSTTTLDCFGVFFFLILFYFGGGAIAIPFFTAAYIINSLYLVRIFFECFINSTYIYIFCVLHTTFFLIKKTCDFATGQLYGRTKRLSIPWHIWIKATTLLLAATGYFPKRPTRGVYVFSVESKQPEQQPLIPRMIET